MSDRRAWLAEQLMKIRRAAFAMRIIPDGADKPLVPALPSASEIDPEDEGEVKLWDRLMPKYRGLLNAKVINKQRFDS